MWSMYPNLFRPKNLESLQDYFQLTETDTGVAYQSVFNTDLFELLKPYLETVDYRLYFDYANRIILGKFIKHYAEAESTFKDSLIKKAVYHALKGEEYNLRTLIETTNFNYEPLENYYIKENIVTTASISSAIVHGELNTTGTTNYGSFVSETVDEIGEAKKTTELSKPEYNVLKTMNHGTVTKEFTKDETITDGNHTDNFTHTKGTETDEHETILDKGTVVTDKEDTNNIGKRKNVIGTEEKVSAYNSNTYQPNTDTNTTNTSDSAVDSTTSKTTVNKYTDTTNTTDTTGERQDKDVNIYGEKINTVEANNKEETIGYVDSETIHYGEMTDVDTTTENPKTNKSTNTQNPHEVEQSQKTLEHKDDTTRKDNGKRERELHGRYGFTTVQSMIEAERKLANLNVSDVIIDIIIHAICEGVLYTW